MPDEMDEVHQALRGALTTSMNAAAQVAQRMARSREQQLAQTEAESRQRALELQTRLDAERSAARAQLAPVHRDEWWDQARSAEEISRLYETAAAWQDSDASLRDSAERIRTQVHTRYGVDVDELPGHHTLTDEAAAQRTQAQRDEQTAAQVLAGAPGDGDEHRAAAEEHQAASQEHAAALYDSAERRREMAEELDGLGVPADAVRARVLADTGQAKPVRDAVATKPKRSPRKATARNPGSQQLEQSQQIGR